MARRTIAERLDDLNDLLEEVRKAKANLAALEKSKNFVGQALLVKAAKALLLHLVKVGVKRLIAKRKRKT